MAITDEQWMAFLEVARLEQPLATVPIPLAAVVGRFIVPLAKRTATFWLVHKATLIPVLSQFAVAALNALASAIGDIELVNPPGPE